MSGLAELARRQTSRNSIREKQTSMARTRAESEAGFCVLATSGGEWQERKEGRVALTFTRTYFWLLKLNLFIYLEFCFFYLMMNAEEVSPLATAGGNSAA
jgi:hypothetical protein